LSQDHAHGRAVSGSDLASLRELPVDALLPAIDGLLFLVTRDGFIHDLRAGTASELYADPDRFLGRRIGEVLPPEVATSLMAVLATVGPGEAPVVRYSLPGAEGQRDFEARILPLAGDDLCLAFINHVTDTVRAEHELHERSEMLRAILQAEPECVKVIDRAGLLVEINPAGLEILEMSTLQAAQARPLIDFLVPAQHAAWLALLDEVWAGGQGTLEIEIVGGRGTHRWLELNAVPLRDQDGQVHSVLAVSRDVTDRRLAEAALRKSERRLAEATAVGNIGIFDHDLAAGEVYWSREMLGIFGRDPEGTEEIQLGDLFSQFLPDDVPAMIEQIVQASEHDSSVLLINDQRIIRRDTGEVRWVSYRARTTFDRKGKDARPLRTIGAVVDITDRLALEQRVAQGERLDSIGRLAGGIAHDFNNMLTAILGFAQLIEEDSATSGVNLDDLRQISSAAERARDLTSQLLAFARRQASVPRSVHLNEVVTDSERLVGQLLREDITLDFELSPELWPVHIDPGHVEQILLNLITNAQDSMPSGGVVTVRTANVDVGAELVATHTGLSPGPHVRLSVTDAGIGIAPGSISRIFEPFFTTKGVGDGTGLGLATVHGIAHQNGGDIGVRSEQGRGSTFDVFLPRAHDPVVPVAVDAEPNGSASSGTETLLVVEDDGSVRSLTARLLREAGYRVHVAASPSEAIALVRSTEDLIDLLVTDVVMPQMSGRALADVLRSMKPRLRVLFVSGYADTAFDDESEERLDFLAKPFTPSSLRRRVREILDSPR
jgi:PAS domain S-box-containing protein